MFSHRDFKIFIVRVIPRVYMCVPEGPRAGVLWVGKRKVESLIRVAVVLLSWLLL